MPVAFKIQEQQYYYPEGWQDVTLKKWVQSLEQLKKPEVLSRFHAIQDQAKRRAFAAEFITDEAYRLEIFPYFVDFFCFWSDCPKEQANKLKKKVFEDYYQQLERNFNRSMQETQKYEPTIEHKGQTWHLPERHLQGDTVGAFIEASQLEHTAKELKGNQLSAIPDMLCIFLRKKGETYKPEMMQRKPLFMSMTMNKVLQVSFFLLMLNQSLLNDYLIFLGIKHLNPVQPKEGQEPQ